MQELNERINLVIEDAILRIFCTATEKPYDREMYLSLEKVKKSWMEHNYLLGRHIDEI